MKLLILNENVSQLNFIKKHLKDVDQESIEQISEILYNTDPTSNKKYIKWLIKQFNNNNIYISELHQVQTPQIRLPEDQQRLKDTLEAFDKYKARIPSEHRDLMKIDIYQLDNVVDEYVTVGKSSYVQLGNKIPEGAELIANEEPYKIFVVEQIDHDPILDGHDNQDKIKALETLGVGSKWCTRADYDSNDMGSMASHYLANADVYVVYKNNKPFMQFDLYSMQFMDARDHEINLKKLDDQLKELLLDIIPHKHTVIRVFELGSSREKDIDTVRKTANFAYKYAKDVIGGRWPEGEKAILLDWTIALQYANEILKERWPELERKIVDHPSASCSYAAHIIGGRWPEAEPYIMKDAFYALKYAEDVIKGRWPEAESLMLHDPGTAYHYAHRVAEERVPAVEKIILRNKSLKYTYDYAVYVIRGRWPEAEPLIMKSPSHATMYSLLILKKRWPEAEPYIKKDEKMWKFYEHEHLDREQLSRE